MSSILAAPTSPLAEANVTANTRLYCPLAVGGKEIEVGNDGVDNNDIHIASNVVNHRTMNDSFYDDLADYRSLGDANCTTMSVSDGDEDISPILNERAPKPITVLRTVNNNNNNNKIDTGIHNNIRQRSGLGSGLALPGLSDSLLMPGTPSKPSAPYSVLTPRGAKMYMQDKFQPGSMKGSMFTLIICIVGAGALSLPWAFRVSGLLLGILLLLMASGFTFLSLHFLVCASLYISERPSYRELSLAAGGPRLATFTSLNMMCNLFGTTVSYLVACGSILDLVISVLSTELLNIASPHSYYQEIVIGIALLIVFPLSLMRSMSALRFGSLVGISCSTYLCLVIIINYFRLCDNQHTFETHNGQYHRHTCFWKSDFEFLSSHQMWNFNLNSFLMAFPIFVFAYSCQPNVLPIYVELQRRSVRRMHKVIRRALYFAATLYVFVGMFGYLTFVDGTCGNILQNDFRKHPEMIFAAVSITVSCMFTLPICIYAFRQNVTVFAVNKVSVHWVPHTLITFVMIAFATLIAVTVSNLATVLGILGSTTNPCVAYLLPNIFFIKLVPKGKAKKRKIVAYLLCALLISLSLASFVFQIFAIFDPSLNPASNCDYAQKIKS